MARRVVLLQVRDDPRAQEQERLCFLESCGLDPSELTAWNLVTDPRPDLRLTSRADAVLIGGAGSHSATEQYPFSRPLEEIIRRLVAEERPTFASCYGHHVLVRALGGDLITDHTRGEVGTFDVELTRRGGEDPLLEGFPYRFAVQLGHHDVVLRLPAECHELAYSEKCRNQMLRVAGKPIYSTQFHPELSEDHLRVRLLMYRDDYLAEQTTDDELSLPLHSSEWADRMLRRFFDLFVGREGG